MWMNSAIQRSWVENIMIWFHPCLYMRACCFLQVLFYLCGSVTLTKGGQKHFFSFCWKNFLSSIEKRVNWPNIFAKVWLIAVWIRLSVFTTERERDLILMHAMKWSKEKSSQMKIIRCTIVTRTGLLYLKTASQAAIHYLRWLVVSAGKRKFFFCSLFIAFRSDTYRPICTSVMGLIWTNWIVTDFCNPLSHSLSVPVAKI